ncbi:hypothetical protein SPONN_2486 [uncultured Candidatus Thioglobus sp.]|nr:hypothetical protein SPONN_2486 [uncultured Candidatus Thioglobus sp.]
MNTVVVRVGVRFVISIFGLGYYLFLRIVLTATNHLLDFHFLTF